IANYTGLAYRPDDDSFWWIINEGAGAMLVNTSLIATILDTFPIASPAGGEIGDITWNPSSASFWGVDIENDTYFEFTTDGSLTGNSFQSPGLLSAGGGAFGTGITAAFDESLGAYALDVVFGIPSDLRASRVLRLNTDGSQVGLGFDLSSSANQLGGWVTGVAYVPNATANLESEFFCDLTGNRIVEVKVEHPGALGIANLTCFVDADSNVSLQWENPQPFDAIEVRRGSTLVGDLLGTQTGFTDAGVESGSYTYRVIPILPPAGSTELPESSCDVVVGFGRLLQAVAHMGDDPLAITVAEKTGILYVSDLNSGEAHMYDKQTLAHQGFIPSPFGTDTTSGLAWRSREDTLVWFSPTTGDLMETELDGTVLSLLGSLISPEEGAIADIAYDSETDMFWGVDISEDFYFQFSSDGNPSGEGFPSPLGPSFGNGLAVVGDALETTLDLPLGDLSSGLVEEVIRVLAGDGSEVGLSYEVAPVTGSGFVNGIAWSGDDGSGNGIPVEYLVGNDTNAIYKVSLVILGDTFIRGDINDDSSLNIVDATFLLFFLFKMGDAPTCDDSADVNDDGSINTADVISLLNFLFSGSNPPPPPFENCGQDEDDTDSLLCNSFDSC
ncbi:MAG: hypothetical protein V3T77_00925, partial [Planctomycetota bacterium]